MSTDILTGPQRAAKIMADFKATQTEKCPACGGPVHQSALNTIGVCVSCYGHGVDADLFPVPDDYTGTPDADLFPAVR